MTGFWKACTFAAVDAKQLRTQYHPYVTMSTSWLSTANFFNIGEFL